ncbi:F0F1 ATP synthase subunit gamma [Candidatus Berkiella aquae]|uniref:ATP synthase gamma chain n=1 Tax=Candidatus Berkiella aquae TaxID=295108 RepID=A0A0Q9YMX7_9GAMM|nr:F0F1 ATP synthase subunit gamma [Candidatus Berkiella aquae]MCS5712748.1 F0F1 ATP synthase subunit gamma [Candidatus Berkiella aquae]
MSGAKEIRSKIKSVKSTQKITRAMEMVAASKMRKAQNRMLASRPYANRIRTVIRHLSEGNTAEYRHPYMIAREPKRIGIIVVATDRGLCGGLNVNNFRHLIGQLQDWQQEGKEVSLCAMGTKSEVFLRRLGLKMLASASHLGDTPSVSDVIGPVSVMLNAYNDGLLDALYISYNRFVNTMSQQPVVEKLLPIKQDEIGGDEPLPKRGDYIYEPDAKELLDLLLTRYIESQVYHGVVENFACEQAARMLAMRSASDNAGELIDSLQLAYNKARQASITRELAEIVGGAAAV